MNRTLTALAAVALICLAVPAFAVTYYDQGGYGDGGVSIRMHVPEGSVLNPGEQIAFRYQTLDDAYVVVFNIDTQGNVHLLHPEGDLDMSAAHRTYEVPEGRNSTLLVSGETGVEFVFAMTIPDRSLVDDEALAYLRDTDARAGAEPYHIDGDPFIAANLVAAELVRGISRREGVYLDYTYFFVNERVDYPCYLCGACDGGAGDPDCATYRIVADFPQKRPLAYPLPRGYAMLDSDTRDVSSGDVAGDDRVIVQFYPYEAQTYGYPRSWAYRVYDPWYYEFWYWSDPWCYGWNYYPYPGWGWGWSVSIGWGWGWGSIGWGWGGWYGWGGYYCSNWYYPCYPSYAYSYPGYGGGSYYRPERFKSKYKSGGATPYSKSGDLVSAHRQSARRDPAQRVASKSLRGDARATSYRRTDLARSSRATSYKSRAGTTRLVGSRHFDRRTTTYQRRSATYDRRSSVNTQRNRTQRYTPPTRTRTQSRSPGVRTRPTSQRRSAVRPNSSRAPSTRQPAVKSGGSRSRSSGAARSSGARSGSRGGGSRGSAKGGRR